MKPSIESPKGAMKKTLLIFTDQFNWKIGALLVLLTVGYGLREMNRSSEATGRENLNILDIEHQLPLSEETGSPESLALLEVATDSESTARR